MEGDGITCKYTLIHTPTHPTATATRTEHASGSQQKQRTRLLYVTDNNETTHNPPRNHLFLTLTYLNTMFTLLTLYADAKICCVVVAVAVTCILLLIYSLSGILPDHCLFPPATHSFVGQKHPCVFGGVLNLFLHFDNNFNSCTCKQLYYGIWT